MVRTEYYVIEYTKIIHGNKEIVLYRLFDKNHDQSDAEAFCEQIKALGGSFNIRTRFIDTDIFD